MMKRSEAKKIVIREYCQDCRFIDSAQCKNCEDFENEIQEILVDELDMKIRNKIKLKKGVS